jgi:hypothetical protein
VGQDNGRVYGNVYEVLYVGHTTDDDDGNVHENDDGHDTEHRTVIHRWCRWVLVVKIRVQVTVISTTDITNRYLTVELQEITIDYTRWQHKLVVNKGATGLVYDQTRDVAEGTYPVWVGITAYVGSWTLKVTVLSASGQKLLETQTTIGSEFVRNLGNITVTGDGGVTTDGFDVSQVIKDMMEKMLPPMMKIMAMSMMINMMAGLMQSMANVM